MFLLINIYLKKTINFCFSEKHQLESKNKKRTYGSRQTKCIRIDEKKALKNKY